MLIWRGWGIGVFFCLVFWLIAGAIVLVAFIGNGSHLPTAQMNRDFNFWLAMVFVTTAISVFCLYRYRETHPKKIVDPKSLKTTLVPRVDDFYGISLKIWSAILLVIAIGFAALALLGRSIF